MQTSMARRGVSLLVAGLLLILSGCGVTQPAPGGNTQPAAQPANGEETTKPRTLRVSTFKGQPYYVTTYFLSKVAPPNVKIELVETATSSEALDALLKGDTDAAYIGLITTILAVSQDRPVSAVASVGRKGTRIVVRADSDIKSVKDLAGKNIATSKATNPDMILRELLSDAGVDPIKGVNYILLATNAHVEALINKQVDAVATTEPYGAFLVASGQGRQLVDDPYKTPVSAVGNVLVLRKEMIQKDPQLAQQIVELHAKATVYARDHKDEVVQELVKASKQEVPIMKAAVENSEIQYNIDDDYVKQATTLVDRLIKFGYLKDKVDTQKVFDLQFLPGARQATGKVY